jgi:hypothetical protein
MTRDLKPTRYDLQRLAEHFGSVAHLALELGVTTTQMRARLEGKEEIPLEQFETILALVAARLKERK